MGVVVRRAGGCGHSGKSSWKRCYMVLKHERQWTISQAIARAVEGVALRDLDSYEMFRVPALARAGTR
jgi:hypothetical protein